MYPRASLFITVNVQGQPTTLESQFRLTYSMLLNLMRVETLRCAFVWRHDKVLHVGTYCLSICMLHTFYTHVMLPWKNPIEFLKIVVNEISIVRMYKIA